MDQVVDEPTNEATGEYTQDDPKPKQGIRTNVLVEHRIRAADIVLACCILAISGLKAIAVIIAAVAHANVCLSVPLLEPLGTSVLAAAPAANSLFAASSSTVRILLAREALADKFLLFP